MAELTKYLQAHHGALNDQRTYFLLAVPGAVSRADALQEGGIGLGERGWLSSKQLKIFEARNEKWRLHVEFATRFATRKYLGIDSVGKSGGREGFIPAPEVAVFKRFPNIPEYPYLRKYLARKPQFDCAPAAYSGIQATRKIVH